LVWCLSVRPSVCPSPICSFFSSVDAVAGVCSKCHTKQQHQRRTRTAYVSVLLYENQPINLLVRPRRPHAVRRRGLLLQTTDVAWSECVGPSQPRAKTDEPIKMPSAWEADSRGLKEPFIHIPTKIGGALLEGRAPTHCPLKCTGRFDDDEGKQIHIRIH